MPDLTNEQRDHLRTEIGKTVIALQNELVNSHEAADVLPEIIAALLSLASYIARNNAGLEPYQFMQACYVAAAEED